MPGTCINMVCLAIAAGLLAGADITHAATVTAPNTTAQAGSSIVVPISISGGEAIEGSVLDLQINPPSGFGGSIINLTQVGTSSDNFTLVFEGNATSENQSSNSAVDYASSSVTTVSGSVTASGVLALLSIDLTGATPGTYAIDLNPFGSSSVDPLGSSSTNIATYVDGILTVSAIPEPLSIAAGTLLTLVLLRRRCASFA